MELPTPGQFVVILIFSTLASLYVFWHAERNGTGNPTRWGIFAFVFGPLGVLLYFGRNWLRDRR